MSSAHAMRTGRARELASIDPWNACVCKELPGRRGARQHCPIRAVQAGLHEADAPATTRHTADRCGPPGRDRLEVLGLHFKRRAWPLQMCKQMTHGHIQGKCDDASVQASLRIEHEILDIECNDAVRIGIADLETEHAGKEERAEHLFMRVDRFLECRARDGRINPAYTCFSRLRHRFSNGSHIATSQGKLFEADIVPVDDRIENLHLPSVFGNVALDDPGNNTFRIFQRSSTDVGC